MKFSVHTDIMCRRLTDYALVRRKFACTDLLYLSDTAAAARKMNTTLL